MVGLKSLPELHDQYCCVSCSCSVVLGQLHKPIIVIGPYNGSLVEALKLITYRLVMIGLEAVILE